MRHYRMCLIICRHNDVPDDNGTDKYLPADVMIAGRAAAGYYVRRELPALSFWKWVPDMLLYLAIFFQTINCECPTFGGHPEKGRHPGNLIFFRTGFYNRPVPSMPGTGRFKSLYRKRITARP